MATLKVSKLSNCKKCRFQADLYMCVSENTTEFITKLIFLKPNQVINNLKERRMSLKSPDRLRIALMTDSTLIINCPFQKLWDFMHPCLGFPGGSSGKEPTCQYRRHKMQRTDSLEKTLMLGKIGGRRRRGTEDEMVGWHH